MSMEEIRDTVCLSEDGTALDIIDQTLLPARLERIQLRNLEDIWDAIYRLRVRGAPAIGVSAAYGIYLAASSVDTEDPKEFRRRFQEASAYLDSARPTAVNLSWALRRMQKVLDDNEGMSVRELKEALHREADAIYEEDKWVCRRIGDNGLTLLAPGMGILTHCNAGRLAAVRLGTATAPIYVGEEQGYRFRVYCDETRPLLQGARLTAFELMDAGIDTTVICDNMAPTVMRNGWVDAVLVGCDRVAANGDTANKVGTAGVALAARRYGVPFYVCAPSSTIDPATATGADIVIEERDGSEITEMWYKERMAPADVKAFNPSFDVTDAGDITAFITEYGIAYPPFEKSLASVCRRREETRELPE